MDDEPTREQLGSGSGSPPRVRWSLVVFGDGPIDSLVVRSQNRVGQRSKTAISRSKVGDSLLVLFVVALLAPAGALAVDPSATMSAPSSLSVPLSLFTVRGSNGYLITVFGAAGGAERSTVSLSASRGASNATYTTEGTVSPTRMEASFGRLGALSLRFRPSERVRHVIVPPRCRVKGFPAVAEARLGAFVGTIRFRGEGGYTTISDHRIRGRVGEPWAVLRGGGEDQCLSLGSGTNEAPGALLSASSPGEATSFGATAEPPFSAPVTAPSPVMLVQGLGSYRFDGSTLEDRSGMLISRSTSATGAAADFIFNSTLSSATVTPPAPFSGVGTFGRTADGSSTWTGSLNVSLPGRRLVKLTGPRFKSSLRPF
jgi:hypothetical protein